MRTTLEIDDDVLSLARRIADRDGVSIGAAISRLVRSAVEQPVAIRYEGRVPVFDLPADSLTITNEMVRDAINEL